MRGPHTSRPTTLPTSRLPNTIVTARVLSVLQTMHTRSDSCAGFLMLIEHLFSLEAVALFCMDLREAWHWMLSQIVVGKRAFWCAWRPCHRCGSTRVQERQHTQG